MMSEPKCVRISVQQLENTKCIRNRSARQNQKGERNGDDLDSKGENILKWRGLRINTPMNGMGESLRATGEQNERESR